MNATLLPWLFAFAVLIVGVYRAERWAWPGDVLLILFGFTGWVALLISAVLFLYRRWPAWCNDVATLAPALAWRVLLPALPPEARSQKPEAATGATTVLPARPLALHEWMRQVNDIPDLIPHVAATGRTGAGKTTLILLALGQRLGELVICTPKNKDEDPWGQFPAIRAAWTAEGMDLSPIKAAIDTVYAEWLRRSAGAARHEADLTLVIDEYTRTAQRFPEVRHKVLEIAGSGRSAHVRLVLLDTESNVEAWDWRGRGEARKNLLFIECQVDMLTLTRTARMGLWGEPPASIDVRHVAEHAARVRLGARAWPGLAYLPAPVCVDVRTVPVPIAESHTHTAHTPPANDAETRIAQYVKWRQAKLTREHGRALRQADGEGLDDAEWAEAGKRLGVR